MVKMDFGEIMDFFIFIPRSLNRSRSRSRSLTQFDLNM